MCEASHHLQELKQVLGYGFDPAVRVQLLKESLFPLRKWLRYRHEHPAEDSRYYHEKLFADGERIRFYLYPGYYARYMREWERVH